MLNLSGKRVLLICPSFFGYQKKIYSALVDSGGICVLINDRVSENIFFTICLRMKLNFLLNFFIKRYFTKILDYDSFDYVLVISPEGTPKSFIEAAKVKFNTAKFILYMWDSFKNKPGALDYLHLFDSKYSFDKNDCSVYSSLNFHPLFFTVDSFESDDNVNNDSYSIRNDLVFAGSLHGDRYTVIEKIRASALANGLKVDVFYYFKSKFVFLLLKFFSRSFNSVRLSSVSFEPLAYNEFLDFFEKSKAIIDVQNDSQQGLTMRTFEVLSMRKKLITTNHSIKDYDFYNKDNILIVDRTEPVVPISFFETDFCSIDSSIISKYSLKSWLNVLLFS